MALSGVELDPDCVSLFNDMKLRSIHKWATFKIEKKKKIILDQAGDPTKTEDKDDDRACFGALQASLTDEPRYILYDFGFKTAKEGRIVNKLAFIFWCPDSGKIGDKMIYASSKDTVKRQFTGLSLEFQANDTADLDYDTLSGEVERKA